VTTLSRISLCATCHNLESWESPSYSKTLSITSNFDLTFGTSIAYYSRFLVTPLANMLQGPYYTQILMGTNSMFCIWVWLNLFMISDTPLSQSKNSTLANSNILLMSSIFSPFYSPNFNFPNPGFRRHRVFKS